MRYLKHLQMSSLKKESQFLMANSCHNLCHEPQLFGFFPQVLVLLINHDRCIPFISIFNRVSFTDFILEQLFIFWPSPTLEPNSPQSKPTQSFNCYLRP